MEGKEHNIPAYVLIALISSGGSHVATKMGHTVDSVTIEHCQPFIEHQKNHSIDRCDIEKLELKLSK